MFNNNKCTVKWENFEYKLFSKSCETSMDLAWVEVLTRLYSCNDFGLRMVRLLESYTIIYMNRFQKVYGPVVFPGKNVFLFILRNWLKKQ